MKSLQFQVSSTGLAELLCALELQFLNWQPDTLFIGIIRAKMFKLKLEEASGCLSDRAGVFGEQAFHINTNTQRTDSEPRADSSKKRARMVSDHPGTNPL
jgi:hypothetical protein